MSKDGGPIRLLIVDDHPVVRAGLRSLEREEQQYEAKIAALKAAIDAGDASGIAEGNVFGRVRKALKLPASPR